MKITIKREELLRGIQTVQNVISSRSTLPILSNILLKCENNSLRINATDLDIGISCEIPVDIVETGAITIPAKRFSDIVRELPSGDVLIHAKKTNQIDIEGDQCRFKLQGLPADEFPKFPEFHDKEVIQMEQSILKDMFRLTSFSVSHEESRYVLNGVLVEIEGENVRMVATDGRRMAKITKPLLKEFKQKIKAIIPIKAVQEIGRNLKDEGQVSIVIGTNQVLVDIGGVLIATRIIDGEFPNYNQVIPKPVKTKARVNTQEFFSAIKRANLLATPDFQAVKFEIFKDKIVVSKTTPDVGESREEIFAEYTGEEVIVGFNPAFLIDFLKNVEQEEIEMEINGPDKPAVIRIEEYLYLVLPMRI